MQLGLKSYRLSEEPLTILHFEFVCDMLVSSSLLFEKCYGKYAIAAINIWCMEQVHALFMAAHHAKAPFIVQMTPIALQYGPMEMLLSMIRAAAEIYPGTVFAIHLDHGNRQAVREAISSGGFTSVMIDASHESYSQNVAITKAIVEEAHAMEVEVEAELGILSGVEDNLEIKEAASSFTRPDEVEDFVSRTGCDSLAVAIGTSHGAYKFSGDQTLKFHILDEIRNRLPRFPLVLHGGSEVDSEEVKRINITGGNVGTLAKGVPPMDIKKAITYGICKVNIATDARMIWTRVHREYFAMHPEQFDPVPPGKIYMDELVKLYIEKFRLLGATDKSGEFKV